MGIPISFFYKNVHFYILLKIMHFYHPNIVLIYVCTLLKYSYVSSTWSSLGMSSYKKYFVGLQTHMANIWHPDLCNPKQWTLAPLSQLAHYWHIRSMISLCTTSPLVIKQYTHDTLPIFGLRIHDTYPFIILCNHGVVIPIMIIIRCDVWFSRISSHAFILITWLDWLCLRHKDNPIFYKDQTFSSKCVALIIKIVTCQIRKGSKWVIKWQWNPRKLNETKQLAKGEKKSPLYLKNGNQNPFW